jgi:hypothetical protein
VESAIPSRVLVRFDYLSSILTRRVLIDGDQAREPAAQSKVSATA